MWDQPNMYLELHQMMIIDGRDHQLSIFHVSPTASLGAHAIPFKIKKILSSPPFVTLWNHPVGQEYTHDT